MRQHGLLRPFVAAGLSDGTLRFILLAAALLLTRPPELMILNEPEAFLRSDLLAPQARLMVMAPSAASWSSSTMANDEGVRPKVSVRTLQMNMG